MSSQGLEAARQEYHRRLAQINSRMERYLQSVEALQTQLAAEQADFKQAEAEFKAKAK